MPGQTWQPQQEQHKTWKTQETTKDHGIVVAVMSGSFTPCCASEFHAGVIHPQRRQQRHPCGHQAALTMSPHQMHHRRCKLVVLAPISGDRALALKLCPASCGGHSGWQETEAAALVQKATQGQGVLSLTILLAYNCSCFWHLPFLPLLPNRRCFAEAKQACGLARMERLQWQRDEQVGKENVQT